MKFELVAPFKPTGDQPVAIKQLVQSVNDKEKFQTLLGVTGSGKTFTMANVIAQTQKPTLILSHNKTLAAQLYGEFKSFFPKNAVEYYISYYDYYQPEAFLPTTNLYIEKDLSINSEIEKLRLSATSSLMSGRRDVIVVASVSCIYGIGNPEDFSKNVIKLKVGDSVPRNKFLYNLVEILYNRTEVDFTHGSFRINGDTIEVFVAYADFAYRFIFWDDELESIQTINPITGETLSNEEVAAIFPANLFVTDKENLHKAINTIQDDMMSQIHFFENERKYLEAKRLKERTEFDLEMIREIGYCSGIENYSRYFDGRSPGDRPFCLLDYFPEDYLMFIDESHVTIPQVKAMWGGDRSRKINLVDYGFRLPAALDNRPLTFNEFENLSNQTIFVSATPTDYELQKSEGVIVEQVIRPTGLLDPEIEVFPSLYQVDQLITEIQNRTSKDERVLVTTITKRMAEELAKYLLKAHIRTRYIHSEIDTLERVEILRELRLGVFNVLVGVNLLREGLDLPEVSLVVILDADKEGFLRNERSLIQTIGRAARNVNGKVIMFADKITNSMQKAIDETNRRRSIQQAYNEAHSIIPQSVKKEKNEILNQTRAADSKRGAKKYNIEEEKQSQAADPILQYLNKDQIIKLIDQTKKRMEKAAKEENFLEAARLRDEMYELENKLGKG